MDIQTVERLIGDETTLRVTRARGDIFTVPDDPGNRHRQMIAEWEAAGGTIATPTPAERLAEAKARKRAQALAYAERLAHQTETPAERRTRLDRVTVYTTAPIASVTLSAAQLTQAVQDHDTAAYLVQLAEALQNGLAIIDALATPQDVRNFDVRTDITWPAAPA